MFCIWVLPTCSTVLDIFNNHFILMFFLHIVWFCFCGILIEGLHVLLVLLLHESCSFIVILLVYCEPDQSGLMRCTCRLICVTPPVHDWRSGQDCLIADRWAERGGTGAGRHEWSTDGRWDGRSEFFRHRRKAVTTHRLVTTRERTSVGEPAWGASRNFF